MTEMRREDAGQACVVVFAEPQRIHIELPVAGEHGIERGQIAKGLFDDGSPCIHEQAVYAGRRRTQLCGRRCGQEQPEGVVPLGQLVER